MFFPRAPIESTSPMLALLLFRVLLWFQLLAPTQCATSNYANADTNINTNTTTNTNTIQQNRTIDDTLGDITTGLKPVYSPATAGTWELPACTTCLVQPSPSLTFQGTWTAATYRPELADVLSIDLSFTGEHGPDFFSHF